VDQMSIGEFATDSRLSAKALRLYDELGLLPPKRFGEISTVTDLSFALEAGTITGFLGPNGAGKTTTLRMIQGLATPTSGRALVFDHPYAALPRAALRIGAVLEATDFHPGRSGRDHLRMLGRAVDAPDPRADEVLRLVELGDAAHRRVKGYSLGMRQRLGLAAALLGDPELLILDEPANGLDPEGVRWLRDFLHRLACPLAKHGSGRSSASLYLGYYNAA
jgi:ABC-2 type transport system ATP-binding protein